MSNWKKGIAVAGAAAIALGGAVLAGTPALADGDSGEVRGYLWPGGNNIPNWEGTYRMPDGSEAWCASIWAPEPIYADGYVDGGVLTKNNGDPMPETGERSLEQLAYIVSEASEKVLGQGGKEADDYASAVSVIVHDWTNAIPSDYNSEWALSAFDGGTDPNGTGQDPRQVREVLNRLVDESRTYSGEWNINLSSDVTEVNIGEDAEVTGTLTTESGTPIPGKQVRIEATGATTPEGVTTGSDGSFSFDATITDADAMVTASRIAPANTVTMNIPTSWAGNQRPQNMVDVSTHAVSESVTFAGTSVSLGTSATDQADGDKILAWDGGVIVDEVRYTGLTVGKEYTVTGELMDKATGEGTGITGETVFTAEAVDGTVSVEFVVPEGYAGDTLVVFERLYNAEGKLQAAHEDIEDEAQTVKIEDEPVVPGKPGNPTEPQEALPTTGSGPLLPLGIAGLLFAGLGISAFVYARRRMTIATDIDS